MARGHDVTLMPLYTPLLHRRAERHASRRALRRHQRLPAAALVALPADAALRRSAARLAAAHQGVRRSIGLDRSEAARRPDDLDARRHRRRASEGVRQAPRVGRRTSRRPTSSTCTNSMLIGLARPLARGARTAVCCTLQGEDSVPRRADRTVPEPRARSHPAAGAAMSIASSPSATTTRRSWRDYLRIPADRIAVVPLGINMKGFEARGRPQGRARRRTRGGVPHRIFRAGRAGEGPAPAGARRSSACGSASAARALRLEVAGYLAAGAQAVSRRGAAVARARRPAGRLRVSRRRRSRRQDRRSCATSTCCRCRRPTTNRRAFRCSRRWRAACRSSQPRRGAFTEIVGATGGGLLVASGRSRQPGRWAVLALARSRAARRSSGAAGREGVREHYTIQRSADALLRVYEQVHRDASAVDRRTRTTTGFAPTEVTVPPTCSASPAQLMLEVRTSPNSIRRRAVR